MGGIGRSTDPRPTPFGRDAATIRAPSPFFTERERAALGWADAVNALPHRSDTDVAWPALREHFSETEIAELGYTIAAIRGWNAINLSLRIPIPEHPAPGM